MRRQPGFLEALFKCRAVLALILQRAEAPVAAAARLPRQRIGPVRQLQHRQAGRRGFDRPSAA